MIGFVYILEKISATVLRSYIVKAVRPELH